MKNIFLTLLGISLLPLIALASPVSVDRLLNNHIEPLVKTDFIQAPYYFATSTTATSTFAGSFITGKYLIVGATTTPGQSGFVGIPAQVTIYGGNLSGISPNITWQNDDGSYFLINQSQAETDLGVHETNGVLGNTINMNTGSENEYSSGFAGQPLGSGDARHVFYIYNTEIGGFGNAGWLAVNNNHTSNKTTIAPLDVTGTAYVSNKLTVGSTTPFAALSVSTSTPSSPFTPLVSVASSTNASLFTILGNGRVGIGTSTPGSHLAIQANGGQSININASATSTFSSGINVQSGCFSINGVCINGATGISTSTGSYRNQTATLTSVNTLSPNASSTYAVSVSASIRTITAGTLTITATYTNVDGVSSTATFFPMGLTTAGLSGTGSPALSPLIITPMKNTAVTVVSTFTGAAITYDIDASILPLGTATL